MQQNGSCYICLKKYTYGFVPMIFATNYWPVYSFLWVFFLIEYPTFLYVLYSNYFVISLVPRHNTM